MTQINGMSVDRLAMFADSVKDLTYKEMKWLVKEINNEILAYDGQGYDMADVLTQVADEMLEEFKRI